MGGGRVRHLRADPVMARIIQEAGPIQIAQCPENFQVLVDAIIFQQALWQRSVSAL
jgi:hypothetical protein